jgi:FMN reductase
MSGGDVVGVVGNPQPGSRTAGIGLKVGERLSSLAGSGSAVVIDLAEQPEGLLRWKDPGVEAWRTTVLGARALVVASPTYKASFTGLIKLFLDTFGSGELAGLPTVAVMTGGSADHSLAVQLHLTPVLTEIGASCPARGLYLGGPAVDDPDPVLDPWWTASEPALRRALSPA